MRYYIEQEADRLYYENELNKAKARARRLSRKPDADGDASTVYLIAVEYDPAKSGFKEVGQFVFNGGYQTDVDGKVSSTSPKLERLIDKCETAIVCGDAEKVEKLIFEIEDEAERIGYKNHQRLMALYSLAEQWA